jgi:Arc/MetJ-type ribon-helix-helix transcriptional regulator
MLMGTFNFKAPVELWATMKDVARKECISVSEMIRQAVGEWLERRGRGTV